MAKAGEYVIEPSKSAARPKQRQSALEKLVRTALDDMKAVNVQVLDVRGLTDVADTMVIASGTSDRHVRSIAEHVVVEAKKAGHQPMGVEGKRDSEWVLVDLRDVLLHVMLPRVREFYQLEQLWEAPQSARKAAAARKASKSDAAPSRASEGAPAAARAKRARAAGAPGRSASPAARKPVSRRPASGAKRPGPRTH